MVLGIYSVSFVFDCFDFDNFENIVGGMCPPFPPISDWIAQKNSIGQSHRYLHHHGNHTFQNHTFKTV